MLPRWRRRAAAVAAARACVGTRFRPQGRVPGLGLDCIGVAVAAARGAGVVVPLLPAYALGGDHDGAVEPVLIAMGCRKVARPRPGDVLLYAPAPGQRHLAVLAGPDLVHAHAGLGRVVEGPADPAWELLGAWALPGL